MHNSDDIREVLGLVECGFRLDLNGVHGRPHWRRVAINGARLARVTPDADPEVVRMFALLHDAERLDEFEDKWHGPRARRLVLRLHAEGLIPLNPGQLSLLGWAISEHSLGFATYHPTVGCCWDADRLDLTRFGIIPRPSLMSTRHGRKLALEAQRACNIRGARG